jgi:hypothetical protein
MCSQRQKRDQGALTFPRKSWALIHHETDRSRQRPRALFEDVEVFYN